MRTMIWTLILAILPALAVIFYPFYASAAAPVCDTSAEGVIVYNVDHKMMQFCNGTQWLGMGASLGGGTSSMVSGWPDAITCSNGAASVNLYHDSTSNDGAKRYYELVSGAGAYWVRYVSSTGAYDTHTGLAGYDCVSNAWSIAQLNASGKTFDFVGGSADGISALTGDITASGTGSVAASIANGAVTASKLWATGTADSSTFLRGDGVWAALAGIGGGGGIKGFQVFTSSGTYTKTSGANKVLIIATGGGGGSNGGGAWNDNAAASGSGGSTAWRLLDVSSISTVTVTVGAGGSYPGWNWEAGGSGGQTSFGTHLTARGGAGGGNSPNGSNTNAALAVNPSEAAAFWGLGGYGSGTWYSGQSGTSGLVVVLEF